MRFATYQHGSRVSAGLIRGQFIYDLAQACFSHYRRPYKWPDLRAFLEADGLRKIEAVDFNPLRDDRRVCTPLWEVRLRAPVPRPPKIVGVGLNYRDHAAEQKKDPPAAPLLFSKAPTAVMGDGDEIRIPRDISEKIDYEIELAAVIGKEGFRIPKAEALTHVFGFTVFNDVTARDIQAADKQWFRAKSFATFAPMGPIVVTPDEVNLSSMAMELRVNGTTRQKSSTGEMIFDVPTLIEYMSACFPLEVGDVIATGTPAGVGVFRNPPVFLKAGDQVEAEIEGIGKLSNPVK
ncbi:MAG: fumarylacetoacetate hydrolase family protein [Planctomycetes bacterium]|nr:fumarylacetoacetate hydrolase family protein [Planctomycetota bacterium]